jgi:hypothetical protein
MEPMCDVESYVTDFLREMSVSDLARQVVEATNALCALEDEGLIV